MTASVKALSELKEAIRKNVDNNKELYLSASHQIHANPEIGNEEFLLQACSQESLRRKGLK